MNAGPFNLPRLGPKCHWACRHFHVVPLAAHQYALGANDHTDRTTAALVALNVDGNASWHSPGHPVWCEPSACQFIHLDCRAITAHTVGDPGDAGCDDFGVGVGVAADLVLAAIDFAARLRAFQQNVFKAIR